MTLPTVFPNYRSQSTSVYKPRTTSPDSHPSAPLPPSAKPLDQAAVEHLSLALSILHEQWRASVEGAAVTTNTKGAPERHRIAGKTHRFEAKYAIEASEQEQTGREAARIRKFVRQARAHRNRLQFDEALDRLLGSPVIGGLKVVVCSVMVLSMAFVAIYPVVSPLVADFSRTKAAPKPLRIFEPIMIDDMERATELGPFVASAKFDGQVSPATLEFTADR